jgi:hypothetical protein
MNVATKNLNDLVRAVAKNEGWEVWDTYSDKRKDGTRRIKYMRNGWVPGKPILNAIESSVKAKVSKYDNVVKMGWDYGDSDRGSYIYFYIVVNDVAGDFDPSIGKVVATEEGKIVDAMFKKSMYVYAKQYGNDVEYTLTLKMPIVSIGKDKGTTKLTPKKAEAVKTAIGPSRIKSLIKQGWTSLPEKVYTKLTSL